MALLGALDVRDVLDHVDGEPHAAFLVEDGRGLDARPAVLGAGLVAVAHRQRGRALARQRAAPRQLLERDRAAVLGGHLEAGDQLGGRGGQQLLRVREAQQPHGRVVGVDEATVGRLGRHRVGDALDDGLEVVARAPGGRVQASVVDRQRAAVGQVLRPRQVLLRVVPAGHAVGERDVADHRAAHAHGDHERRDDADLPHQPVLLGILRDGGPELVRDVAEQLGLAGADDLRRADRRVGIERIAAVVLLDELALGRVDVLHHDAVDPAVGHDQLDEAPVRVLGHGEARHGGQRLAVVQRIQLRRRLSTHGADSISMRDLRPRTRAGTPRTGDGGPPRRGGWRSPCPASRSRPRRSPR